VRVLAHRTKRWILVDAQVDDTQRGWFGIDFHTGDVPRDRFVVAGQAWASYRSGEADPVRFGLSLINEAGDWWIAASLMRDSAACATSSCCPGIAGSTGPPPSRAARS